MTADIQTEKEAVRLKVSLEEAVGPDNLFESPDMQIDGLRPALLVKPGSSAETARCLEICSRFRSRVVPAGLMTWLECGNPVRAVDVVISLCRMSKVTDYNPADLTISTEAGIAMKDLSQIIKNENQWLPLDAPGRGTLGGVVACGSSGPLRLGYGTPRDYVIGLRLAHIDGAQSKSGGRVVKNVAGYDLNKLYVGSFGTLAVITDVILKLRPLPAASATTIIEAAGPPSGPQLLYDFASKIMSSRLRPASLFVVNQRMSARLGLTAKGHAMLVRFVESEAAVRDQVNRLKKLGDASDFTISIEDKADDPLWSLIADLDASSEVALKASVTVSRARMALEICERRFPGCIGAADLGMGLIRLGIGHEDPDLIAGIKQARAQIESLGGTLVIERAPSSIRREADAWGDAGPAVKIMRALKQSFDPNCLLSPGRFVIGSEK
jgi:glycolate oxidase FAD binding subunit